MYVRLNGEITQWPVEHVPGLGLIPVVDFTLPSDGLQRGVPHPVTSPISPTRASAAPSTSIPGSAQTTPATHISTPGSEDVSPSSCTTAALFPKAGEYTSAIKFVKHWYEGNDVNGSVPLKEMVITKKTPNQRARMKDLSKYRGWMQYTMWRAVGTRDMADVYAHAETLDNTRGNGVKFCTWATREQAR